MFRIFLITAIQQAEDPLAKVNGNIQEAIEEATRLSYYLDDEPIAITDDDDEIVALAYCGKAGRIECEVVDDIDEHLAIEYTEADAINDIVSAIDGMMPPDSDEPDDDGWDFPPAA